MINDDKLNAIQQRLDKKDYLKGPSSARQVEEDMSFLLKELENKKNALEAAEKKASLLLQQNMELTQEMENIRSDFGGGQR